jgi:hypothetical protein
LRVGAARTRRRNVWRWLAVGGLLVAPLTLTACTDVRCSQSLPTETIVGRLVARQGSTATFSIESLSQAPSPPSSGTAPPVLVPGHTVAVAYFGDHAKYLRVGSHYLVELYWRAGYFRSDVHTADDPCSRGTAYADGHAIDTRTWERAHLVEIIAVVALVPLAFLLIFLVLLRLLGRATNTARSRHRSEDLS